MSLPEGIIFLDYSEKQRLFYFDTCPDKARANDWKQLKAMTYDDAFAFCQFMDRKYVDNRKTGDYPELSVVKLELDLFLKLKNIRRKYAGR